MRNHRAWTALVGLPLVAGLVLGANQTRAGAYLPWILSIIYWVATSLTTWWLLALATVVMRRLLRPWTPPAPAIWLLGGILGSFAARPAIYAIVEMFRPFMAAPALRQMVSASADLQFLAYYLTNWSAILVMWCAACWWLERPEPVREALVPGVLDADRPMPRSHGLLLRLPTEVGRDVIAVQAEDHYVRFHTKTGSALILGSMSQAVADLEASGFSGQRTHRSWWVTKDAVIRGNRRGRHLHLELSNGVEVPVSVSYRQAFPAEMIAAR